jgi:hypothetical protein
MMAVSDWKPGCVGCGVRHMDSKRLPVVAVCTAYPPCVPLSHSPAPPGQAYPLVHLPEAVTKTRPGLSAGASDPAAAAQSLTHLLQFAKDKVHRRWHTRVQLHAVKGADAAVAYSAGW